MLTLPDGNSLHAVALASVTLANAIFLKLVAPTCSRNPTNGARKEGGKRGRSGR